MRIHARLRQLSGLAWVVLGFVLAACGNGGKPGY